MTNREAFDAYLATLPARFRDEHAARKAYAISRGDSAERAHRMAYVAMGLRSVPTPHGMVSWPTDERVDFDEASIERVPAGQPGGGQFGSGGGGASASAGQPRHGVASAKAERHVAPKPDPMPKPGSRPSDYKTPDTEKLYKSGDTWQAKRVAAVHQAYADERLGGVAKAVGPVTVSMTGGGPASGKSTALLDQPAAGIPEHGVAAHINPDTAKEAIPEYREGIAAGDKAAAGSTHEESSHMAKVTAAAALAAGKSVVYDAVGDSGVDKVAKNVARFRREGAQRVVANYATIDPAVALERAQLRAAAYGRVVPADVFNAAHADVNATAWGAGERGIFDEITVWDTDVAMHTPPIKVWSRAMGQPVVVHNADLFAKFKARAGVRGDAKEDGVPTVARMYEIVIAYCRDLDPKPEGYTAGEQGFLDRALAELAEARKANPAAHLWLPAE